MGRRSRPQPASQNPFDPLDGVIGDTLDLHGYTGAQARDRLATYLDAARCRQPGALLHIITGKGRHSPGLPVIKTVVRTFLAKAPHSLIAAWGRDLDDGGFVVRLSGGRL